MGYTTDFDGSFSITPNIKPEHAAFINKFSQTRRMKRDAAVAEKMDDPVRKSVGLPVGDEGAFFIGGKGHAGQDRDKSVVDGNSPPTGQPGLWCQWIVEDGELRWDGGEKFYEYEKWLKYLVDNFFKPWGYTLNGTVEWFGEDRNDRGMLVLKDNKLSVKVAKITYETKRM